MMRHSFYEVDPKAYIFRASFPVDGEKNGPEEVVRQWCAFELIRAYGIPITDLDFEHPVSVGSRTYRIDIVILQDGKPWAVVECKKREYVKHEHAMAQAISYADSQNVHAEYAVYTNGDVWRVKRKMNGNWLPVPDLPLRTVRADTKEITYLLRALNEISPLLYQLNEPISGQDAERFVEAMQVVFNSLGLLTADSDHDLVFATDNLLRILTPHHINYQREKLAALVDRLNKYFEAKGLEEKFDTSFSDPICGELQLIHATLQMTLDGAHGLVGSDILLLRLMVAILEYGQKIGDERKPLPQINRSLHEALREYLDFVLRSNLGFHLPDVREDILNGDLRHCCSDSWKACGNRECEMTKIGLSDIVGMLLACFKKSPKFLGK